MKLKHQDFYEEYAFTCNRCKSCTITDDTRCLPICPSYNKYGFFTECAGGKAHVAQKLLEGSRPAGPELREAAYRCQLCQACKVTCPVTIDTYLLIRDLREALVRKGAGPMPGQERLLQALREHGHPQGADPKERDRWLAPLGLVDAASEPCDILLYAGCSATWPHTVDSDLGAAVRILRKAGVRIGALGSRETCCGAFALELGDRDLFVRMARDNIASLSATGAPEVMTVCPYCHAFLKVEYAEEEGDLGTSLSCEVSHVTQVLDRVISEGRIAPDVALRRKVTFHDPCHLGRHAEEYEAPRTLLRSIPGLELVEMERNRESAYCCGGGTGVREGFPDFSEATVRERLREAADTGAEILVTSCPHCHLRFVEGMKKLETPPALEVKGILELLAASMGC